MSSIETRRSDSTEVTTYRVRYRLDGSNKAVTFTTLAQARKWQALLDQAGPSRALDALADPTAATTRTVAEQVTRHIDQLTGVTEGTRADYRSYLARDIGPHLGTVPLPLLDRSAIAAWVNALAARGLSAKSIRNRHSLLSAALTTAAREGLIAGEPPSKGMRMPKDSHERREMVMLTRDEFTRLLDAMDPFWHPLCVTMVATGIRWGEATALTVGDVDLDQGTARIRQAWKHTDGHGHVLGPPKSAKSRRTVELEPGVAQLLRPLVDGRKATALVFTNRQGGPIRQSSFHDNPWTPAVRALAGDTAVKHLTGGRPRVEWVKGDGKRPRPHDLRHTYASWAIAAGQPMAVIQRSMGHESITTTIDTYGHLERAQYQALARATSPLAVT